MKILLIGDIVGRPGRRAISALVPALREELDLDFVVANGENVAGGVGITPRTFEELLRAGVDVVTSGNHIYRQREIVPVLESEEDRLLRPANFPPKAAGRGATVREDRAGRRIAVINLQGRVYMTPSEDPFAVAERLVGEVAGDAAAIVVDIHGEATSEKQAMGWFLDGRVAAVVGTHTHVPTADERVLPGGTAYISDLGMTGPYESCLGVEREIILRKFVTGMPVRFQVASGDVRLFALLVTVDEGTGLALAAERIERRVD